MALPEVLPSNRREAIDFYVESLQEAARRDEGALAGGRRAEPYSYVQQAKRWLIRNDLFYLLAVALKRRDMDNDWIFDRCREVQNEPNGCLDLWAREHYKSTIITFGLSIQDILASHGDDPEPRYNGREVTIGIFSHTRGTAKDFLEQIRFELQGNDDLKALFPDVLYENPKSEAPSWGLDTGITVKRNSNPREATVEAWGLVDGQPTGKHFFILNYDDTVEENSVSTPEQIEKTTSRWELSTNLGTEGGWERYAGTKYHLFDTYSVMVERGSVKLRLHPCTRDGTENFEPDNCVLKSPDFLAKKRRDQGPYTFGCQLLLDPIADKKQGFNEDWLRYWPADHARGLNVYILCDPSSGKKDKETGQKNKKLDYTVFEVVGLGADKRYYTLDRVRDRLNLTERTKTLIALHKEYRPLAVGYQQYGLDADIEHIEYVQNEQNYRFDITPITNPQSKPDRIKRLVPIYEQGRWYEPETITRIDWEQKAVNLTRTFVQEEYLSFPVCKHDDILDCKATILDMDVAWPKAQGDDTTPKFMKKLRKKRRSFMAS